ncbi:hypothetical protein JCM19992_19730 [Thermostilla marina]
MDARSTDSRFIRKETEVLRRFAGVSIALLTAWIALIGSVGRDGLGAEVPLWQLESEAVRRATERVAPFVVRLEVLGIPGENRGTLTARTSSGLWVDDDLIVTSHFVFADGDAPQILAALPDGTQHRAVIVGRDHSRHLVLLRIEDAAIPSGDLQPVPLDEIRAGLTAVALGRGLTLRDVTLNIGIISAADRFDGRALQTDANTGPRNYGGPLIDLDGRVFGVIVPWNPMPGSKTTGAEWYDSGIGFAVPLTHIMHVLPRWVREKDLFPPAMPFEVDGGSLLAVEPVVTACRSVSPAYRAGIRRGDRIVSCARAPVRSASDIRKAIANFYAGDTIEIEVGRDGKTLPVNVSLERSNPTFRRGYLGILLEETAPDRSSEQPVSENNPPSENGVAIRYVFPDEPAAKAGLKAGDQIVAFDGVRIRDAAHLQSLLEDCAVDHEALLSIRRDGRLHDFRVQAARYPFEVRELDIPAGMSVKPKTALQPGLLPNGLVRIRSEGGRLPIVAFIPNHADTDPTLGMLILVTAESDDVEAACRNWSSVASQHHLIVLAVGVGDHLPLNPSDLHTLNYTIDWLMERKAIDPHRVAVAGEAEMAAVAVQFGLRLSAVDGIIVVRPQGAFAVPSGRSAEKLRFLLVLPERGNTDRLQSLLDKASIAISRLTIQDEGGPEARIGDWIDQLGRL